MVRGELAFHTFWEDERHIAFLSGRPNTKGVSVVTTKEHHDSYAFDLPDDVLSGLMIASKQVAKVLDAKLTGVARTGMIVEGFGVDHVHTKLYPMHGTASLTEWKPIGNEQKIYFQDYPGYLTSLENDRPPEEELKALAEYLKNQAQSNDPQNHDQARGR
jgi:diadenosine tetraphosphate (Ap4A) HIT family hydrolase